MKQIASGSGMSNNVGDWRRFLTMPHSSMFRIFEIVHYLQSRLDGLMRFLIILPLLFISICASLTAQTTSLRYDLPTGNDYKFKHVEETSVMAQSNDGHSTEIDRQVTRYISITVESADDNAITYLAKQDTAIVEESSEDARIQRQNLLMQNLLTGKTVRVRQSATGRVESTQALDPLGAQELLGPGANDVMFAQRAAIFPTLPDRPISVGMTWTETRADTLRPNKTSPQFGKGSGVRYLSGSTEYNVSGETTKNGIACFVVEWKSISEMEEQIIFDRLEEYTEDHSRSSGEMHLAKESSLPVKVDVVSERESTRALFGAQASVIPTTVNSHTILELISQ